MLRNPNTRPLIVIALITGSLLQLLYLIGSGNLALSNAGQAALRVLLLSTVGAAFIVWLDNFIAKRNLIAWIPGIPHFGGRWEGWKVSDLSPTGNWHPICIEINQGFFISAREVGVGGEGNTANASISLTNAEYSWNPDHWKLIYTYATDGGAEVGQHEADHQGTFILRLRKKGDVDEMEGEYFTNVIRYGSVPGSGTRGARGVIKVARTNKQCSGSLSFNESDWALPRPAPKSATLLNVST